jgi:hypothetical protein
MAISEQDVQNTLIAVLAGEADPTEVLLAGTDPDDELDADAEDESEVWVDSVDSFADDGVLSYNKGVVVRLSNGSEFQLTIVRSR